MGEIRSVRYVKHELVVLEIELAGYVTPHGSRVTVSNCLPAQPSGCENRLVGCL